MGAENDGNSHDIRLQMCVLFQTKPSNNLCVFHFVLLKRILACEDVCVYAQWLVEIRREEYYGHTSVVSVVSEQTCSVTTIYYWGLPYV